MRKMNKTDCVGCEDNYYNNSLRNGCWNFRDAKLIMRKRIYADQRPPWMQKPSLHPDCYHEKGCIFIKGNRTC